MNSRQPHRRLKRRSYRHDVLLPCQVLRARDHLVVSHLALELSATGLQVLTGERVLTGEPVRVVLRLPETGRWLTLEATVARVLHGRRPGEWGRRLGLDLEGLADGDLSRLVAEHVRGAVAAPRGASPSPRRPHGGAPLTASLRLAMRRPAAARPAPLGAERVSARSSQFEPLAVVGPVDRPVPDLAAHGRDDLVHR